MQYTILLDRDENTRLIEIQEQARFIKSVFEVLQIPIEFNPDEPLTVNDKIQFKKDLAHFKINIIDDMDGGLKVYVEKDLVAEWRKPSFAMKKDLSQVDPKKMLYIEMYIDFSTIFEDNGE